MAPPQTFFGRRSGLVDGGSALRGHEFDNMPRLRIAWPGNRDLLPTYLAKFTAFDVDSNTQLFATAPDLARIQGMCNGNWNCEMV